MGNQTALRLHSQRSVVTKGMLTTQVRIEQLLAELSAIKLWDMEYATICTPDWAQTSSWEARLERRREILKELDGILDSLTKRACLRVCPCR